MMEAISIILLCLVTVVYIYMHNREQRKNEALRAKLLDSAQVIALREQETQQLTGELKQANESKKQEQLAHDKTINALNTATNTVAKLEQQVSKLQAAQRIRDSNR